MARERDASIYDRSWIRSWVLKTMRERGLKTGELAKQVRVKSQRISQITGEGDLPGLQLLWRLAAALDEDDDDREYEYTNLSQAQIRAALERLVVSISPRRLFYLLHLPHGEAQRLIDAHGVRRASGPPTAPPKNK